MTTNAELAILTLVQEQPRHGYEIEQVIQQRDMREWTDIGFSSIYYILSKLEKQGLLRGHMEAAEGRGPARKVYHLTEAGSEVTRQAVLEILSTPQFRPSPLQLGLANLGHIPSDEAIAALRAHSQALSSRIDHIKQRAASKQPRHPFVQAMFDHALIELIAERDWIDHFVQQIREDLAP